MKIEKQNERWRDAHTQTENMGRMSTNTRVRVVSKWKAEFPVIKIRQRLSEEGIQVSRKSLYFLLKKYNQTCSVADLKRTPRRRLLTDEHFRFMDEAINGSKPGAYISATPWHGC